MGKFHWRGTQNTYQKIEVNVVNNYTVVNKTQMSISTEKFPCRKIRVKLLISHFSRYQPTWNSLQTKLYASKTINRHYSLAAIHERDICVSTCISWWAGRWWTLVASLRCHCSHHATTRTPHTTVAMTVRARAAQTHNPPSNLGCYRNITALCLVTSSFLIAVVLATVQPK